MEKIQVVVSVTCSQCEKEEKSLQQFSDEDTLVKFSLTESVCMLCLWRMQSDSQKPSNPVDVINNFQ